MSFDSYMDLGSSSSTAVRQRTYYKCDFCRRRKIKVSVQCRHRRITVSNLADHPELEVPTSGKTLAGRTFERGQMPTLCCQ